MDPLLSAIEMARWTAWKRASDTVLAAIARDIAAASDLSAADFAVLSRVREIGDGAMRQQELATLLGWQRSRLSRHVSRMQSRGLVVAVSEKGARMIKATEAGREPGLFGEVPDDLPYLWPSAAFPRWPARRRTRTTCRAGSRTMRSARG